MIATPLTALLGLLRFAQESRKNNPPAPPTKPESTPGKPRTSPRNL